MEPARATVPSAAELADNHVGDGRTDGFAIVAWAAVSAGRRREPHLLHKYRRTGLASSMSPELSMSPHRRCRIRPPAAVACVATLHLTTHLHPAPAASSPPDRHGRRCEPKTARHASERSTSHQTVKARRPPRRSTLCIRAPLPRDRERRHAKPDRHRIETVFLERQIAGVIHRQDRFANAVSRQSQHGRRADPDRLSQRLPRRACSAMMPCPQRDRAHGCPDRLHCPDKMRHVQALADAKPSGISLCRSAVAPAGKFQIGKLGIVVRCPRVTQFGRAMNSRSEDSPA